MSDSEKAMRKIADAYVEHYGFELRRELEELNREPEEQSLTPAATVSGIHLQRRVRKKISAEKRRPYLRALPLIAACIALMVIYLPNLFSPDFPASPAPAGPAASAPSSPAAPAAPAAPQDSAPQAEAPEAPTFEESDYAVIPLSAPLPQGFTQAGFDRDLGKSIYYIEDIYLDNVIVTLEMAGAPQDTSGLVEISIGGSTAFGKQTDAYSLLTFISDDVQYTLTSRHDINTLLRLGSAFI